MRKAGGSGCSVSCLRKGGRARSDGVDGSRAAPSAHADVVHRGGDGTGSGGDRRSISRLAASWTKTGRTSTGSGYATAGSALFAEADTEFTRAAGQSGKSEFTAGAVGYGTHAEGKQFRKQEPVERHRCAGNSKRRERHGAARRTEGLVVAAGSGRFGSAIGIGSLSGIAAGRYEGRRDTGCRDSGIQSGVFDFRFPDDGDGVLQATVSGCPGHGDQRTEHYRGG